MPATHTTDNERRVLRAILCNNFHDQDRETCTEAHLISTWSSCINDSDEPSGIEGQALAGVVTSLGRKRLVRVSEYDPGEYVVELTAEGLRLAREATPTESEAKAEAEAAAFEQRSAAYWNNLLSVCAAGLHDCEIPGRYLYPEDVEVLRFIGARRGPDAEADALAVIGASAFRTVAPAGDWVSGPYADGWHARGFIATRVAMLEPWSARGLELDPEYIY